MTLRRAPTATATRFDGHHTSDSHLHGHWLILAQLVLGVLAVFALIVFIASFPVYYIHLPAVCQAISCALGQLPPATAQTLQHLVISFDGAALSMFLRTSPSSVASLVWL